jgi:DNA-binding XRE family transcriptional regulator
MARINTDKVLAGPLRKLRAAIFAENSTQFAKRIGVSIQRLNNFENGFWDLLPYLQIFRLFQPSSESFWTLDRHKRALSLSS